VDHELLRNLLLNLGDSDENDTFQAVTRTDNVFGAGAGFRYFINRGTCCWAAITPICKAIRRFRASPIPKIF
jgi:hypothetical protein